MGFAGRIPFVWSWTLRELGKEVGEWRGKWKGALPFKGILREFGEVAVRREDVEVASVERWDGNGTTPEDEVLGILADLAKSEDVALANLIESAVCLVNDAW